MTWNVPRLTLNSQVSLSLVIPVPPSTVSLSASPNPVGEGSAVTVTAMLSEARSGSVTIPLTLTDDTAESTDHGTLTSITIGSGATSGTGTITTNQDADEDDETFTVALGSPLPSGVTAGSPSSVPITISDDDKPFVLSVDATPACGATVTDASVQPQRRLILTPAPAAETETEYRWVTDTTAGQWRAALPIKTNGSSVSTRDITFAQLLQAFPGFAGLSTDSRPPPASPRDAPGSSMLITTTATMATTVVTAMAGRTMTGQTTMGRATMGRTMTGRMMTTTVTTMMAAAGRRLRRTVRPR